MFFVCEKNVGGNEGSLFKCVYWLVDFFFFLKKISKFVIVVFYLGMFFFYFVFVVDNL